MRVKGLGHVEMLLPLDKLEAAVSTYAALLGVPISPPKLHESGLIYASASREAGIEFIAPAGPDSPLTASLASKGDNGVGAVGPITWEVADLGAMRKHVESLGIAIVHELEEGDAKAIYLNPLQCYGYIFGFIERPAVAPAGPDAYIKHINRLELLLPTDDIAPAGAFLEKLLDTVIEVENLSDHANVVSGTSWEAGIEVFGPGKGESVLTAMQAKKGYGAIGPIVWEVDDIERFRAHAISLGHSAAYEFATDERYQLCLNSDTLFGYTATFTQVLNKK